MTQNYLDEYQAKNNWNPPPHKKDWSVAGIFN